MQMLCTVCNAEIPTDARFCSQCGERVPSQPTRISAKDTEHNRLLTIMFCDLVDSTAMSTRHEPEIYSEIVRGYLYNSTERLEAYGGQIARYIGDGIMAYFGYPQAQSDDVERAVLAALDVTRMIEGKPSVNGEKLAVRIGIATGQVVIGTSAGRGMAREQVAMGTTPNLAARVQSIAEANQVAICPNSQALLGDRFRYQSSGKHELKGFSDSVPVWIVSEENESLHRSRFRATRGDSTVALIGRDAELQSMLEVSRKATGCPNSILIRGQAGMGKSRLLHAYRTSTQNRESYYLETQCDSYRSGTFLHPFIKLLADFAHIDFQYRENSRSSIAEFLLNLSIDDELTVEILTDFLESSSSSSPVSALPPEGRQSRIYEAITTVIHQVAKFSPVVVVFEDLHWADASTIELLGLLIRSESSNGDNIRLIMTCRPDTNLVSLNTDTLHHVNLNPLLEEHSMQMAREILTETVVPEPLLQQIVTRAAGVPLFLEALCRQVAESANERNGILPETTKLPATIQGLVMEILDRLQGNAYTVQLAATFGMRFATAWFRDVLALTREAFDELLESLQKMHLLSVSVSAQGEYCTFQHALVRQVAYESMLSSQRRAQHDSVARYFESQHTDVCQENPEMLGEHWRNAGNWEKGSEYLLIASERSAASWANESATAQLRSAISLLDENKTSQSKWNDLWYRAHVQLGEVLVAQQKVDDAQQCYEAAHTSCRDNPERTTKLYRRIAEAQQRDGSIANKAIEKAREALPVWKNTVDQRTWQQESLQLDLVEGLVAYWHNDTPTLEKTLNRMSGAVTEFGTPNQQAKVHNHLMLLELRKHQYRVTPDALQHGEHFVTAAKATNKLDRLASALFQEGFTLLFDGQFQRAEANLLEAQELAMECGLKTVEVQVLVYLGTKYRCTGNVIQAEALGKRGLVMAREAKMAEYEGMALANLSWCAWYSNDLTRVEELGQMALSLWQSLSFDYPFQWAATLPLLALAHVQDNQTLARDMISKLASDSQQHLPVAVDDYLQAALSFNTRKNTAELLTAASKRGLLVTTKAEMNRHFLDTHA